MRQATFFFCIGKPPIDQSNSAIDPKSKKKKKKKKKNKKNKKKNKKNKKKKN